MRLFLRSYLFKEFHYETKSDIFISGSKKRYSDYNASVLLQEIMKDHSENIWISSIMFFVNKLSIYIPRI